jgi:hypothetical protein
MESWTSPTRDCQLLLGVFHHGPFQLSHRTKPPLLHWMLLMV